MLHAQRVTHRGTGFSKLVNLCPVKKFSPISTPAKPCPMSNPKVLDISCATAPVAPDLSKALAILSDATVRRSAVS